MDTTRVEQGTCPDHLLDEVVEAIECVLLHGTIPTLSAPLQAHNRLIALLEQMLSVQQFALLLARGDLSATLDTRGMMAGSLKELQANLRHLTWQTQHVAAGDFGQRVDFMGDFSTAFNSMVTRLAEMRGQVEQQIVERDRLIAELDAFAHTVAHDLRNPLSIICGYASILASEIDTLPPDNAIHLSTKIEDTALRMGRILEELMLLSGVRKGNVQLKPVDMGTVDARALEHLAPMIETAHAEVRVQEEWPVVHSHGPWLEAVWDNYLSNAIKYGGTPPRIEIGCNRGNPVWPPAGGAGQPQAGASQSTLTFWVRDYGPGIAPEDQLPLFAPFTRLGDRKISGHGLGLSIVQRIVEKLGGEAGVRSDGVPGAGSLFYFSLPGRVP